MAGDKHKKKTKGKKAAKRSAAKQKKSLAAGGGEDGNVAGDGGGGAPTASKQRNPKAFTVKSTGRAKLQRARTAEKEQKRMHGASGFALAKPATAARLVYDLLCCCCIAQAACAVHL